LNIRSGIGQDAAMADQRPRTIERDPAAAHEPEAEAYVEPAPPAPPALRMRGDGPYAALLARRFELAQRRLGFEIEAPPLRTDLFVPPARAPGAASAAAPAPPPRLLRLLGGHPLLSPPARLAAQLRWSVANSWLE